MNQKSSLLNFFITLVSFQNCLITHDSMMPIKNHNSSVLGPNFFLGVQNYLRKELTPHFSFPSYTQAPMSSPSSSYSAHVRTSSDMTPKMSTKKDDELTLITNSLSIKWNLRFPSKCLYHLFTMVTRRRRFFSFIQIIMIRLLH